MPADDDEAAVGGGGDMESTDIWLGDGSHSSLAPPPPTPTPMPPLRDRFTGLNHSNNSFSSFTISFKYYTLRKKERKKEKNRKQGKKKKSVNGEISDWFNGINVLLEMHFQSETKKKRLSYFDNKRTK